MNKVTKISGDILLSTLDQLKVFGASGKLLIKDVLKAYKIRKIEPNKFYNDMLAYDLFEGVLKNFGKDALYFMGLIELEFAAKNRKKLMPNALNTIKKNKKKLMSFNENISILAVRPLNEIIF